MHDRIRLSYEETPYPELVFGFTHPDHLGALARLYGLQPADPATARVLDVGCGSGANLIWISRSLPRAQCLGVDLAESHLTRAHAAAQGIGNVEFVQADLVEFDLGRRRFDYIIAHGFFSWVPDPVKERLLALCQEHLSDNGVAMLSYNCLPGFRQREGLRMLMQMENERLHPTGEQPHGERLKGANQVLELFELALSDQGTSPYLTQLQGTVRAVRDKPDAIVLHDELELINDPFHLLEAVQWAHSFDLDYPGDTDLRTDWLEVYPRPFKQAVARHRMAPLQALQYGDFLLNRAFRRSIFCKAGIAGRSFQPLPEAVTDLWLRSSLEPAGPIAVADGMRLRFRARPDGEAAERQTPTLEVKEGVLQALLVIAARTPDRFLPFAPMIEEARQSARSNEDAASLIKRIGLFVLKAAAQGQMRLALGDRPDTPNPGREMG